MSETITLKHVHKIRAKGHTYWYHRVTGERLPSEESARALRVLEINASLADEPAPVARGTWADLIGRYKSAPEYKQLADLTRRDYARHLDAIAQTWGHLTVRGTEVRNVRKMRDKLADTPRKANYRVAVLSILFGFAAASDRKLFGDYNPAAKVKKLREGSGYSPWPENVIHLFAEAAYSELRRVVIGGALGTGQRGQDVIAMGWIHVRDDGMEVTQQKTRERLLVPRTREFNTALAEMGRDNLVLFTTKTGKPWGAGHLQHEVERVLKDVGFPGYSLHGLRFNAARRLREAGASWEDVAAVTGHRTAGMARMYGERAERAREAVKRTERQRTTVKPTVKPLTRRGENG